jgi:hypothetical protein
MAADTDHELTEPQKVVRWRFREARDAGLTRVEARLYAESEIDCSDLRRLVANGATPKEIVAALL